MSAPKLPENVLLVDDEGLVRMDTGQTLEDAGYRIIEASSADQALMIIASDPLAIDILYTDIDMPGTLDGFTLAQEVHERWPRIRLVITSGRGNFTDDDMPDAGKFVSKPATPQTVLRAVKDAGRPG